MAIDQALGPWPVARRQFANRTAGARGPERAERAIPQVAELTNAFADELGVSTANLMIGGRSFGGRMASMAVADGLEVAGLVLLSYPLHPPGRPDKLRIEHLDRITVPTLAVSGERDPFGTPDELRDHLSVIPAPVQFAWVPGNHSPGPAPVVDAVLEWLGTGH